MELTEQFIRERITQIEKEREEFIRKADLQLAAYNGAIQALEGLLRENQPHENAVSSLDTGSP